MEVGNWSYIAKYEIKQVIFIHPSLKYQSLLSYFFHILYADNHNLLKSRIESVYQTQLQQYKSSNTETIIEVDTFYQLIYMICQFQLQAINSGNDQ